MTHTASVPFYRRREGFDPTAELVRRREVRPVSRVELPMGPVAVPVWLVTRYHDARQVLNDAAMYSNSFDRMAEHLAELLGAQAAARMADVAPGPLVVADPPEHTRLRRVLTPEFTVTRMRRLQPRIAQIVAEHLDAMAAHDGPVDLVQSFALPVPSLVICELLGVPYADRAEFQQWGAAQLDRSLSHLERAAAGAESRWYMAELVRRQRADPGEDLLGMLVRKHGAALSDADLIGIGVLLLLAGHETTASMLALSTLLLLEHPDQWTLLRNDPASTDRAVEELLRYLSIVHHPGMRTALRDTVIGDQPIAAGDMVLCSIPGANRDPALGPGGDTFDISRKPSGHLAFGHGIHHCVGAPLARLELRIALPELARRFPALRLAVAPDELVFRADSIVYGVQSLPVRW
ncbi:cytochrome P450 [Nocardia brasiliensis]|uniref:cytochrome P450 n=1 Tax=Nocardia brasiliensis TaxID=37326 RepID=UPI002456AC2F|nr:cytochrome P450 [Nocardia brasiliensis]